MAFLDETGLDRLWQHTVAYAGTVLDKQKTELTKAKAGFIYPLASSVVPDGFLLCDGAAYARTEYPELFAAIGTMYGEGDGSTTFNVPNLSTRVPVGAGDGYELGDIGGEAEHLLTVDEMPSHHHDFMRQQWYGDDILANANTGTIYSWKTSTGGSTSAGYTANSTKAYTGGSQPHNNMPPYTAVNYIIATGKDTGVSVADIVLGAQAIPLGVEYGGTGATNAEEARRNLQITPENIGAVSMTKLWENASPTSAFAAQDIMLDLSTYDMVLIFANLSNGQYGTSVALGIKGTQAIISASESKNRYRKAQIKSDRITFGTAMLMNSYGTETTSNTSLIPFAIYGIKGVAE